MAIFQIGKGQYEIDDALDPEQRNNAIRHIYQTMEATRQGSLGYSVDNAQKMLGKGAEALGRLTGFDALENYGAGVVEQQEKDLAEGRYVPDYQGSFTDQEGVMNKLGWTGEKIVENLATSGVALGGSVAALAAAPFSAPAATLIGGATLGTNLVMSTGEAALEAEEKTGDYSAGGALATGGIVAFLDRFGAKIPKDKIANMTGKELVDELVSKGYTNAASELVKTVTKKAVREGATEAAQENVIMTGAALQGADYNLDEVINKNIDSFVVGSGMGAGQSVASGGVKALVGTSDNVSGEPIQQETAAATFAQRLDRIAKEGQPTDDGLVPFNLNDVDRMSDNGARAVMDVAHTRIATEIKELSKVLRDKLNGKERDDFERELGALGEYVEIKDNDVVLSAAELRSSKNKTKSAITTGGYKAVERLVGDTREGQELLNLLRESQMLTSLHNKGYVGGLSQYTEGLNPFKSQAGYGDRSSLETVGRLGLSGAAGAATQGASLAAQLGAVGGARAVDAMTGSRSRVDKFVKDNQGGRPLTASGPSLREDQFQAEQDEIARADADAQQQAQNEQETAEANRVAGQKNYDPTDESPQWYMETASGLDKAGVAVALRMIERMPSTPVAIRKAIDGYRKSIDTGGKFPNLSPLIRFVKGTARDNPQYIRQVAPPNQAVYEAAVERDKTEAYKLTEGYRRGIAANQKAGSDLMKAMMADRSINAVHKVKLEKALSYIQTNLPKDPLGAIQSTVKELQDAGVSQELIQKYIAPYADRVAKQQPKPDIAFDDRVVPVPYNNKRMQDAFGVTEPTLGGNYINLDDNNADVTGTSYTGGTVAIVDGKPVLETNNIPSDPATKDTGWKAKVNLFKKKAGWSWVDSPRTEETIVSTETRGKHHYSLATDFQTPVTLETYPNQKSEPRLRPSTYGEAVLGNKVGTISVRGKPHPVYDKVSIVPKGGELAVDDRTKESSLADSDPFNIGKDMERTILGMYPTEGAVSPFTVKSKVEGIKKLFSELYVKTTGTTDPIEQTPENVDRVAKTMATEALKALEQDSNAIGWYDRVLDRAMTIMKMIDPDVAATPELETTFKYALAVTSNGMAVDQNFEYAADVFDFYKQNGRLPETKKEFDQGGDNNKAMLQSFNFFNSYQDVFNRGDTDIPLQDFLSTDFRRGDLDKFIKQFNKQHGTDLKVGTAEGVDVLVKGSYVMGPKIGQGFYQNLTGNYDPLTTDIWWMRMWNRHTGRPLEPRKSEAHMKKSRATIVDKIKKAKKGSMQFDIVKAALNSLGEKKAGLYTDDARFHKFLAQLQREGNKWYKNYKAENGVNPKLEKGNLYTLTKTYNANLLDQPQETPKDTKERQYMREVTARAIDLLASQGVDITTADFQALMWYPEKRLFKMIGVQAGNGSDNDYEDAARLLATQRGISNERVEEALAQSARGAEGVDSGSMPNRQDGRPDLRFDSTSQATTANPALTIPSFDDRTSTQELKPFEPVRSFPPPSKVHFKKAKEILESPTFNIGKEGDALEHGINDQFQLMMLGRAFNTTIEFVSNQQELDQVTKSNNMQPQKFSESWRGRFMPAYSYSSQDIDYVRDLGGLVVVKDDADPNDIMRTTTHEVGHGVTLYSEDRSVLGKEKFKNPINNRYRRREGGGVERKVKGSFQEYFFDTVMALPAKEKKQVLAEIDYAQKEKMFATKSMRDAGKSLPYREFSGQFPNLPYNEGKRKREAQFDAAVAQTLGEDISEFSSEQLADFRASPDYKMLYKRIFKNDIEYERGYLQNAAESIVDPFMFCISDPKAAKQEIPKFYKMLQKFFNSSGSPLRFFSMLLAVALATEDEEDERNMMAQGALSPQGQGALAMV